MRAVPECLAPFLVAAEATRLISYQDSAGVWTAGVGHTGPEVFAGMTITQTQADDWLAADIAVAATRLAQKMKLEVIAAMTDHQYAALLSFVFNLGTPGTTIWKVLNGRQWDAVPVQFMRFTKARDPKTGMLRELRGLVNRRAAEVVLWKTADAASAATVARTEQAPSSGLTRAIPTPPVSAAKPLTQSKSFLSSAGAAITGGPVAAAVIAGPGAVKQVSDTISPYAGASHIVQHALQVLGTVTAILALGGLLLMWLKQKQSKT